MDVERESPDKATEAFDAVRDKLAGLTRVVDSMAGEWKALAIPDYSPTLEKMAAAIKFNNELLDGLSEMPALQMVPQELSAAIIKAGKDARAEDHAAIAKATTAIEVEARTLSDALAGVRTAAEQRKLLQRVTFGGAAAGALLWALCAGIVARTMPEGWHLPERMASRTLRLDMRDAGGRLMEVSDPDGWSLALRASKLVSDNHQAIERCEGAASKRRTNVTCTITVRP